MSDKEGIFILDNTGKIIFANSKAKNIYKLEDRLNKIISGKEVNIKLNDKEIVIYPIFENNKLKLFFGVIRDMQELLKIKEFLDITYENVKVLVHLGELLGTAHLYEGCMR